ncbi:MAG: c-type cytochrome domain-containing protein [Pseudobdellovibrio sp.]
MNLYFRYIILFSFFVLGCNYTTYKKTTDFENLKFTLQPEEISNLSYITLKNKFFAPRCNSCHGYSGNISLESYADILLNINLIKKVVFQDRTMPKQGFLSDEEQSYLWNWIKLGTPEFSANTNQDTKPEAVVATYDSINKFVFSLSCKECHSPSGSGKRVLLDKESLMNSPLELIIPGNADESGLIIAIERSDDKRMPPAKEGFSILNPEAKTAIRAWIQNGAKD